MFDAPAEAAGTGATASGALGLTLETGAPEAGGAMLAAGGGGSEALRASSRGDSRTLHPMTRATSISAVAIEMTMAVVARGTSARVLTRSCSLLVERSSPFELSDSNTWSSTGKMRISSYCGGVGVSSR
jgi:hypothetical protein